jgi:ABC-type antimicrobial peptide transport system permease subunit
MFKNYLKIAWRNLVKNKAHSFINIAGLSAGMAVTILIGIWIYGELTFDQNFNNYSRIAKVYQNVNFTAEKKTFDVIPIPLAEQLRTTYPVFAAVSLSVNRNFLISYKESKFSEKGNYVQADFTKMMSLQMVAGSANTSQDINSILISGKLANKLFAGQTAIGKVVSLDNKSDVKIAGVFKDMPSNSSFKDLDVIAPWNLIAANDATVKNDADKWDNNSYNIYVLLNKDANINSLSAQISDIRMKMENPPGYKPAFFLHPMTKWHLYADFKNGVASGGIIDYIWMFGIIGAFVLLLACINFMNLSTARSEKRAKEVGIRKAIGSMRRQLVLQFFTESLLVAFFAFICSLGIVIIATPIFNELSGKENIVLWTNPWFWFAGIFFSLLTGTLAGSYPSLFLSSFKPIEVLKGTFRAGRFAIAPRRMLVVMQFSVSVILIIGTLVIFRQIKFSRDRSLGYSQSGLIEVPMNSQDTAGHFNALRTDLISNGSVQDIAASSCTITEQYGGTTDVQWRGKINGETPLIMVNRVTHDYGNTVQWQLAAGRDFSKEFVTDSSAVILNESAVKLMGFTSPLDESVKVHGKELKVVGVIKDMLRESPFAPVSPSIFQVSYGSFSVMNIRLSPSQSVENALTKIEDIFKKYSPGSPFIYKFVDDQFAKKFDTEKRIGKLASLFAALAVLISCLGLFGMASFMAEQRTKEVGVRKVLGASVLNLWKLLSAEFLVLVFISLIIAMPVAWYFMHSWLQNYQYRTNLAWWVFAASGLGAILITLLTVSFQAIKAAVANPVKSLKAE